MPSRSPKLITLALGGLLVLSACQPAVPKLLDTGDAGFVLQPDSLKLFGPVAQRRVVGDQPGTVRYETTLTDRDERQWFVLTTPARLRAATTYTLGPPPSSAETVAEGAVTLRIDSPRGGTYWADSGQVVVRNASGFVIVDVTARVRRRDSVSAPPLQLSANWAYTRSEWELPDLAAWWTR
jgi:hypothetical protein